MYSPTTETLSHAPYQLTTTTTATTTTNTNNYKRYNNNNIYNTSTHNHTQHRYTIKDWCEIYISLAVSYTNILIGKRAIGTYKGFMGDIMGDIPNYLYL